MNLLKAGFSRVNVTPMLGIFVSGYYKERYASGVLDELEINALALECGTERALMLCMDVAGIRRDLAKKYRKHISEATGVREDAIFISGTHTHTGPELNDGIGAFINRSREDNLPLQKEYEQFVDRKMVAAATMALDDLQPAKMGYGIGQAPNIAFVRRFRMKDGSVKTNPGVDNPDIVAPIGEVDERVGVLRFDREKDSLVLVNFGDHPDVVGGDKISADWPGLMRATVEKALDDTKCIFFNGCQGDVNHVNVHPRGGYLNDMFMDFDDVARGYGHARYMGRVVAGAVLQTYDKVQYVDVDSLKCIQRTIRVPANLPTPEQLPEAHRINDLHNAGRDAELPYEGMMLTTVVAEAARMVRLENGPDAFDMELSGVAIGDVALIGLPGEAFTGIGRGLKETEGWGMVLPCVITNGYEGYFPMQDAYDEGGYEARSSRFKAGVAELMIQEGKQLLTDLKKG